MGSVRAEINIGQNVDISISRATSCGQAWKQPQSSLDYGPLHLSIKVDFDQGRSFSTVAILMDNSKYRINALEVSNR